MGKKSSGKHYTSKGERNNVSKKTSNGTRRERSDADNMLNAQRAWIAGSNPWVTMPNPNKEQTNKRFIRVRYNDLQHGSFKEVEKNSYVMK